VRVLLVVGLLVSIALGVTGCIVYNSVADKLPDPSKPLRGLDQTSKVVDRNGATIAELFAEQNRTNVKLKDIPPHVRQAIIATEDERYYEHKGLDFIGMLRALITDIRAGDAVAGGSTITQQYVKTAFMTPERTLRRKASEAILAYRLEKEYSKDQILEMYLNTIYFGHGSYGIQTAAKVFFGKDVGQLTVAEAAVLAGVIKSPRRYSPYLEPEASKKRRDTVLGQMRNQNYIDEKAYADALASPIAVKPITHGSKIAPYFVEYLKERLIAQYGEALVYRGGLRVTSTLDLRMQAAAEQAVAGILNKPTDPSAALVALDPRTGEILAMVGGRDFATQQFNVAAQGGRQTGSSFKPFVLITALEQGVSPEQTFESGPVSIPIAGGPNWDVTGASGGPMRLRLATAQSVNSVFAQLMMQVGPAEVVDTAKAMGITTKITPVPAVALGGMQEGVTPLEMASGFGTIANGGVRTKPYSIAQVVDLSGTVLFTAKPASSKAIDPAVAYLTTDILKGVIASGTGKRANIGRPAAGKTGTTQKNADAWFVGYTPQLVAAVWIGDPASMKPMNNVHGIKVTGGTFPAQIWAAFMKAALAPLPRMQFVRPEGLQDQVFCLDSGLAATQFCPRKATGLFLSAHLPEPCPLHRAPTVITVPNVIGMSKQDAIATLEKLLLKYAVKEQKAPGVTPGQVTGQDPPAGSAGTTATVVTLVVSSGSAGDKPPTAAFDYSPKPASVAANVKFDGSASTDDGTITKYVWEFGDGTKDTASGAVANHKYTAPGTFDATLWITDDAGHTASVTHKVTVN
jgi:1A family penicillin-binding protein